MRTSSILDCVLIVCFYMNVLRYGVIKNVYRVSQSDPLCFFAKISITKNTFFGRILHTHELNKDTHVYHFWCLISKYTECDNMFIN